MNLENIKNVITSKGARQILLARKHSPKMLFVAGTIGVVGTTVLACRATLKLEKVLVHAENQRYDITHTTSDDGSYDQRRELHKIQIETAVDIAKLYSPAIVVGVASIAALTGSHVILTKRNGALMVTYAGLDRAFKEYRQRVSDEYGRHIDRKFATGAEDIEVEEKTADGKVKATKRTEIKENGKFGGSPYAVVFDEFSKRFSREPGRNAMLISTQQSYANDKLRAQGHLTLNEVYDMLGLPRTKAGQLVGWVYRRDNEEKTGDNYVDFGVFDGDAEIVDGFIDGRQQRIVLDFNVDGVILDHI